MTVDSGTTVAFPSVEAWERDNPHEMTPKCPGGCRAYLDIRRAWMNTSGIDEWECPECRRNGVNEHGH